jgi:hypothetical protein
VAPAFVSILFCLPTVRPVTSINMNYASVITIGVLILSGLYYAVSARHWYTGPRSFTGGAFAAAENHSPEYSPSELSTEDMRKKGVGTEMHV